ncbi:MAG: bifunctional hydroxymethylpyrimidine kinase/phosphomethylpyrimidine kinase [Phocaeicola sp.]
MKKYISILTIAGSDSGGGAGIQADLKTIAALGAYGTTAITALTAQNTTGVKAIYPIPANFLTAQIEAVMEDIAPGGIKIGMINDTEIVRAIAEAIDRYAPPVVVFDPVMVSTSGHRLVEEAAIKVLRQELIPRCTLITPNLKEAEVLLGREVVTIEEMKVAAAQLAQSTHTAVLIKGGHLAGGNMCDVLQLLDKKEPILFETPQIESQNTHGTGCTLSAAITTYLTMGQTIPEAVEGAKRFVTAGIEAGKDITTGEGHGPLNHSYSPIPMIVKEV